MQGRKDSLTPLFPLFPHRTGYRQHIISRPVLYDLLLRQIPAHKVHLNKRVLDIGENDKDDKVFLRTSDNGYYEGDILIGADGAYSAVRQRLYESLKQKGQISKADLGDLPFKCTCLVGQTDVLDSEEFPQLKEPICQFWSTLGEDKPFSVSSLFDILFFFSLGMTSP